MPVGFLAFSIREVLPVQRVWIILPNQLSKSMPGDLRVAQQVLFSTDSEFLPFSANSYMNLVKRTVELSTRYVL
jgi:hypothetical protein